MKHKKGDKKTAHRTKHNIIQKYNTPELTLTTKTILNSLVPARKQPKHGKRHTTITKTPIQTLFSEADQKSWEELGLLEKPQLEPTKNASPLKDETNIQLGAQLPKKTLILDSLSPSSSESPPLIPNQELWEEIFSRRDEELTPNISQHLMTTPLRQHADSCPRWNESGPSLLFPEADRVVKDGNITLIARP